MTKDGAKGTADISHTQVDSLTFCLSFSLLPALNPLQCSYAAMRTTQQEDYPSSDLIGSAAHLHVPRASCREWLQDREEEEDPSGGPSEVRENDTSCLFEREQKQGRSKQEARELSDKQTSSTHTEKYL